MPKLSLYNSEKSYNYKFIDSIIKETLVVGGTDLYIHKLQGTPGTPGSSDPTQPDYINTDPTNIQDLMFLENRDRKYEPDIIRLRGHYNVQALDFDLSQFGLFVNNDIIFIVVHYNEMIDLVGRKLMVGDVIELPHLLDYNPLDETLPYAIKRFYQVTDATYASEGFSPTWYPHLWRIKCEPMTDSQEFQDILKEPANTDNYLGDWASDKTYPPGYVISYGDKNYISLIEVPVDTKPPNDKYWKEDTAGNLRDLMSTYKKNIEINDAVLAEAQRLVPLSGYDNTNLYIVPTYDENMGKQYAHPAPPRDLIVADRRPIVFTGVMALMRDEQYKRPSPAIRIPKAQLQSIWDMTADSEFPPEKLEEFIAVSLEHYNIRPEITEGGSGPVEITRAVAVNALGPVAVPYGTSDNTLSNASQNPALPSFVGVVTPVMDYRADCDPRFRYIARSSPRSFGYARGYLVGNGQAPNGYPVGRGISFPKNPRQGDYFLRIDYSPQLLYRWNGDLWERISENVRTGSLWNEENKSQLSSFINNSNLTTLTDGTKIPERQALSTILRPKPDPLPKV